MTAARSPIVTYECRISGQEHAVPGPDVRIMMTGDAGFVIACDCSEESLDDADERPHPADDHLVNVYAADPSPEEWVALEDAADGWYDTTRWHSPEGYDGTRGQRRQQKREAIRELADTDDGRALEETPADRQAREVECPSCGATEGRKCKRPSGHRVRKPHGERVQAAEDAGVIGDAGESDPRYQGTLMHFADGSS